MTGQPASESEGALARTLGVRELAASIITITIGGGVFLLPAAAAEGLGAAAWLAYVVCALVFVLIVICFAEAGSRIQTSGGPYAYVGAAFGPFWGYLSGVLGLIFATLAHAAVAAGFTQAANALVPGVGTGMTRTVVLLVVFVFFTAINLRGVKQGARMVEIGTVAKLVPLVLFGIVGLFAVQGANIAWPGMPSGAALARTSMMMMFAFFGVETALLPSGEVRDPARTVPRAIFITIGGITLLYLAVQQSAQGILGPELANFKDAPLAAAAERGFGRSAGLLLMAGAAISMLMHTPGMLLAMPRSVYAMARDGYFPAILARVNPKTQVPSNAILAYSAVVTVLAVTGTFTSLLILANIGALLMYVLVCLSVIPLRSKNVRLAGEPFRVPGGTIVPWLAAAALVALLSTITFAEFRAMGIALAVAVALYFVRRGRAATAS
ncbi:MAG: APC family permease [Gemmatimonadetes bacterium]|nr:APC family permease [Gemmatimonadota bacterium]